MGDGNLYTGAFGQSQVQQFNPIPRHESSSTATSIRSRSSSVDSQRSSSGRNKLQKKRTRDG